MATGTTTADAVDAFKHSDTEGVLQKAVAALGSAVGVTRHLLSESSWVERG
jgi:hypothetical protein